MFKDLDLDLCTNLPFSVDKFQDRMRTDVQYRRIEYLRKLKKSKLINILFRRNQQF